MLILILWSHRMCLYNLYDKIVKGGIILFDNYRGVGIVVYIMRKQE